MKNLNQAFNNVRSTKADIYIGLQIIAFRYKALFMQVRIYNRYH